MIPDEMKDQPKLLKNIKIVIIITEIFLKGKEGMLL